MRLHHLLEWESTADVGVDDEEVGHVGGDGVTDWVARSESGVSHGRELGKVNTRTVVETAGGTKGSILAHVAEQRSNAFRLALPRAHIKQAPNDAEPNVELEVDRSSTASLQKATLQAHPALT
jgi:hypothetical protein